MTTATRPDGTRTLALSEYGDTELLDLVRGRPRQDPVRSTACELLAGRYDSLVRSCVHRYRESPEPVEDLTQAGYVGLLKAINNFDPDIGGSLAAYAQPCIHGLSRHSLDAPLAGGGEPASLGDLLGEEDPQVEHTLDMESVLTHWNELPEREQRILAMRFYGNMTQTEIGDRLGISQMHVSRLLARGLAYLRGCLLGPEHGG
jgi:RNA polymerase sigma factor (sigma-70 family)